DADRIGAECDSEHRRRESEIDLRELARQPVDVVGAAPHPAILRGQERQMESDFGSEHRPHNIGGTGVRFIPMHPLLERRIAIGEVLQRVDDELEITRIEPCHQALPMIAAARSFAMRAPVRHASSWLRSPTNMSSPLKFAHGPRFAGCEPSDSMTSIVLRPPLAKPGRKASRPSSSSLL